MSKHILYNLASRSRPDRLRDTISRIKSLAKDHNHTILVKLDVDDPNNYDDLYHKPNIEIALGKSVSKVHAINRSIHLDGWDILVNVSDDTKFTAQGFDNIIRQHCGEDDFVLFPEPFADGQVVKGKNERISVMSIMGNKYYNRFGYVYHPDYASLFCDNEATQVARILGRLKEVEVNIFYHEHPAAGYKVNDGQYRHTESFWESDKQLYFKRKENNFNI